MAAHSDNEPRRVPENESVLDARSTMHPMLLFAIKLVVAVIGIAIAVCVLYVPGWYSFPVMAIDIVLTIVILAILVFGVDNANTNSLDSDRIRRTGRKGAEVQLSDFYHRASFEDLEKLGRRQASTSSQNPKRRPPQ